MLADRMYCVSANSDSTRVAAPQNVQLIMREFFPDAEKGDIIQLVFRSSYTEIRRGSLAVFLSDCVLGLQMVSMSKLSLFRIFKALDPQTVLFGPMKVTVRVQQDFDVSIMHHRLVDRGLLLSAAVLSQGTSEYECCPHDDIEHSLQYRTKSSLPEVGSCLPIDEQDVFDDEDEGDKSLGLNHDDEDERDNLG